MLQLETKRINLEGSPPNRLGLRKVLTGVASLAARGTFESPRSGPGRTRLHHPRVHAGRPTERVHDGQAPDLVIAGVLSKDAFISALFEQQMEQSNALEDWQCRGPDWVCCL